MRKPNKRDAEGSEKKCKTSKSRKNIQLSPIRTSRPNTKKVSRSETCIEASGETDCLFDEKVEKDADTRKSQLSLEEKQNLDEPENPEIELKGKDFEEERTLRKALKTKS